MHQIARAFSASYHNTSRVSSYKAYISILGLLVTDIAAGMELQLASYCLQSGQLLTTAGAAVCLQGRNVAQLLSRSSYHTRSSSSSTESDNGSTCYQSSGLIASRGKQSGSTCAYYET